MGSWTTEAAILASGMLLSAHVIASAIVRAFKPATQPASLVDARSLSGAVAAEPTLGRTWSDELLAAKEKRDRPDTLGADHLLVDTFGLEEDERQAELERQLLAAELARGPTP